MRGIAGTAEWLLVLAARAPPLVGCEQPVVQAIDTTGFRLLAVAVTETSDCSWGDRLYIGPGAWDRVAGIERQLTYQWLISAVQQVLAPTVAAIIRRNEARFIEAFNTTVLAGVDDHPLTLLPGLTHDYQEAIIAARAQQRFADFDDLTTRVACCDHPRELLVERVLLERREGEDAYHWLTE